MPETPPPVAQDLLDFAVSIVREAGELTLRHFRDPSLDVEHKGDGTPVTRADRAAERLLRERIGAVHPNDTIAGEEEDDVTGTTGRRWIIDPIDGTKAFARGVPLYTNLLAFDDEWGPAIGVVNVPALGRLVAAGRGLGCFENGAPVRVNDRAGLDGAYVMTSGLGGWPAGLLDALHDAGVLVRTWGDGYGYVLVATGQVEAMLDPSISHWDVAPMTVVLSEAGGAFSAADGTTASSYQSGLGTNGVVHDELVALLSAFAFPES